MYRHIRLDTGQVFYVGKGMRARYCTRYGRTQYWHRIVNKAGGFRAEIMLSNLTLEESSIKEQEFIELYGRRSGNKGLLCNLTNGGDGRPGYKLSESTKQKISQALRGKPQHKLKGRKRPNCTGDNNPRSKAVVCSKTGVRFESIAALGRYLKDTNVVRSANTVQSWINGQNGKPNWFTFEYESNF